ncbi:SRPBCC family protein [Streptomyces sp. NPDC047000]|uniref:SRPBCC family protein n=1 Tax=Streptomyces sp. NPDC047000 TaxID=3155474 RepID=UPI0033E4A80C
MKIDNEFGVAVPLERAWEALTDLESLAPCMPGAQLTGVEGEDYKGRVRVKVGPVVSQFAGVARFVEKDETTHSAVISASGKDTRGAGNASATVHARLAARGEGTVVTVSTDLSISGRLAQFGSGMIKEVSEKLFAQFVANVEAQLLAAPRTGTGPETAAGPGAAEAAEPASVAADAAVVPAVSGAAAASAPEAVTTPAAASTAASAPVAPPVAAPASPPRPVADDEPLDLMKLAGASVYKRLIPVAVGVVVVGVVVWLLVR